ncbi:MAG: nitrile hydratase subunit beta [Beijerinckiaceae bacterium]
MNSAHDLGGQMGFGPVNPEKDEPYFHGAWEKRALALTLAMGATGQWNIDASRHVRESMHPAQYLTKSYYDIWITALEILMRQRGLVSQDELNQGRMSLPPKPVARVLKAADVAAALARGGPCARETNTKNRFMVGQRVQTKNIHPTGHTRLPRYARGKIGTIEMVHGTFVFPDTNARGEGEQPQWLYTVTFSGHELWGDEADPSLMVSIDAWDAYLEPA